MPQRNRPLALSTLVCALLFQCAIEADRTITAPSVDVALQAAAQAIEKIGFRRSYFGTFQGTARVQGTWKVSFTASHTTTDTAASGQPRLVERRTSDSGEIILDITAEPAGSGKVRLKTKLMNPRAREGSVIGVSGGPPKEWERDLFAAIEQALASGRQSLPVAQEGGAQKIHDRYRFRISLAGKRLIVSDVTEGGKAARAGLQVGDEIVKVFDAKPKRDMDLLVFDMFSGHMQHGALILTVKASGGGRERTVRIADR